MLVSLTCASALLAERQTQSGCMWCHFRENITCCPVCSVGIFSRWDMRFCLLCITNMLKTTELRFKKKKKLKWHLHLPENFRGILYVFSLVHILTKDFDHISVKIIRHLLWYCWSVSTQFPYKCFTSVANLILKSTCISCMTFPKIPATLLPGKLVPWMEGQTEICTSLVREM